MPDDLDFTTTQDEARQPDQPIKEAAQDAPKALYIETPAHPMTTEETLEALKQMPAEEFQAHIDSLRATMDNGLKATQESIKKALETVTEIPFSSQLSSTMDSLLSSLKQFAIQPSTITESVSASLQKLAESLQELQAEALKQDRETIREYLDSEEYKKLTPYFKGVKKKLEAVYNDPDNEETSYWAIFIRNVEDVFALDKEIKRYIRTEHQGRKLTLDEFVSVDDEDSKSIFELLEDQAQPAPDTTNTAPAPVSQSLTVKTRLNKVNFPLDKVNSKMWKLLESDTGAQLRFAVEKAGSKNPLNVIYSIDFDKAEQCGLTISKKLDAFDKRVYIAVSSFYAYKFDTMTVGQIYNAMGYRGTPGARDKERINNSLSKMQMAHIFIDNKEEAAVYKYEHFKYDGYLLPLERVSRLVNGVFVDGVIHLLKEPPMYTFAKNRSQITTLDVKVLQTPLSKTITNLSLEDYLIDRIARAKTGNRQKKILYDTIYKEAAITSKSQRSKAKGKINQLLEHYKGTGFIKGYTTSTDGVTIQI